MKTRYLVQIKSDEGLKLWNTEFAFDTLEDAKLVANTVLDKDVRIKKWSESLAIRRILNALFILFFVVILIIGAVTGTLMQALQDPEMHGAILILAIVLVLFASYVIYAHVN